MDERKKQILHALVKDYVLTAEPVGSRTIAKKYNLGISPATIRNEMADLEEQGYIQQPHTSAGRVPSDKGYRYYVDCLMEHDEKKVGMEEEYVHQMLTESMLELDDFLKKSCQLLSRLTNYTALIARPSMDRGVLTRISLLPLSERRILAIMIDNTEMIFHRVLELPETVSEHDLRHLEAVLQEKLVGYPLSRITTAFMQEMAMQMLWHQTMLHQAMELLGQLLMPSSTPQEDIMVKGTLNMLKQPDFKNMAQVHSVLDVIEAKESFASLLQPREDEATEVYIGSELPLPGINYCSVISKPYRLNGRIAGTIGVLGPMRMDYARVISLVELISRQISQTASKPK